MAHQPRVREVDGHTQTSIFLHNPHAHACAHALRHTLTTHTCVRVPSNPLTHAHTHVHGHLPALDHAQVPAHAHRLTPTYAHTRARALSRKETIHAHKSARHLPRHKHQYILWRVLVLMFDTHYMVSDTPDQSILFYSFEKGMCTERQSAVRTQTSVLPTAQHTPPNGADRNMLISITWDSSCCLKS